MGLTIRPRAIEVSLVPKDEESYQRVLAFRRAIYQSSSLIALGIEQQYYFTAHVTLAYFGNIDREIDRANLIDTLQNYNMHWIDHPQEIIVSEAQLRKFTNMSAYHRKQIGPLCPYKLSILHLLRFDTNSRVATRATPTKHWLFTYQNGLTIP